MAKIDKQSAPSRKGSSYPPPYDAPCAERLRHRLGDAGGLSDFGVNLLELQPGVSSSQRHWHSAEDEFVYVLSGEITLRTDAGEEILRAGDCAAFPKNKPDGHVLVNKSNAPATCLEIGARNDDDVCTYSDVDMKIGKGTGYTRKDGSPILPPKKT